MDRWVLSQLADTVREARERLDTYDATGAGRRIQSFVSDLSNWYVRRTRRRFWNPGGVAGADAEAAAQTLHHCLVTVATLLAPFVPFLAEELNVKDVRFADTESFGAWRAKPNYRVLGHALGRRVQAVADALARDDGSLAARSAAGETVEITLDDGSAVTLEPDQVELAQEVMSGWGVGSENGVTVARAIEVVTV